MAHLPTPAPVQNIKVKKDLKSVKVDDTVQFRPINGGESILLKVSQIGTNKKDLSAPRMFVGQKHGKTIYCLETQIIRVITRSVDNEADWIDDKFVPESDTQAA